MALTDTLLTFDEIAICRTSDWVKNKVQHMLNTIPNPVFIGADGSRFDSTQNMFVRECVDNKIYNRTRLYERLPLSTDIIRQAKEINTGL